MKKTLLTTALALGCIMLLEASQPAQAELTQSASPSPSAESSMKEGFDPNMWCHKCGHKCCPPDQKSEELCRRCTFRCCRIGEAQ